MGSADEPGRGKTTVTRGCEGLSASLSRCAYRLRFCLSGHEPALGWRPPVGVGWRVQRFPLCTFHKAEKDHSGRDASKTHTGSNPLPNGRSKLNPSASAATETTPLKITGQFIGALWVAWRA